MRKSTEIDQITAALVAIQAEVGKIPKDASNPFFKSKYADLPAVIDKAGPIATKHGIAVTQWMDGGHNNVGVYDTLTTLVSHVSGQYLEATTQLHLVKDDPQAHGSAVTYARRYGYMAALGLVADDDDDGNAASMPRQQTREQKPRNAPVTQSRPSPITQAEAEAKIVHAFGPNQDIIPQNQFQRVIYNMARKKGISATELDELCQATVECSFAEIASADKANSVTARLQAEEQLL